MEKDVKVVVVGGGAAGLAAAVELECRGVSCQVLEAQTRLGGRVHSVSGGTEGCFDRGAQMVNGDMSAVLSIARDIGLSCSPVPSTGEDLVVLGQDVCPRRDLLSNDEFEALLPAHVARWTSPKEALRTLWRAHTWWTTPWEDFGEAKRGLHRLVSGTKAPRGSLAEAIGRMLLCPEDEAMVRTMVCEQYGTTPETLDAVAIATGLDRYASERPDLEFHFPQGLGAIINALAAQLAHAPMLGSPVDRIDAGPDGVTLRGGDRTWCSDYVIVAVPPTVARKIRLNGDRKDELKQTLDAFQAGDLIKSVVVYDAPFWRWNGRSGRVSFADPVGLEIVDASYDDGGRPRLAAFLGGPTARQRASLPEEARQRLLLEDLSRAFGKEAMHPRAVTEAVWVDDPWSGGGYNASVKPGYRADAAARLAGWPGRLRFAGAELDGSFAGYVEGAIRSGRKVASGVAGDLSGAVRS